MTKKFNQKIIWGLSIFAYVIVAGVLLAHSNIRIPGLSNYENAPVNITDYKVSLLKECLPLKNSIEKSNCYSDVNSKITIKQAQINAQEKVAAAFSALLVLWLILPGFILLGYFLLFYANYKVKQ